MRWPHPHDMTAKVLWAFNSVGKPELYNNRADYWEMFDIIWDYRQETNGKRKSGLFACEFYGLFNFEIELINLGFKVKQMGLLHVADATRLYIKDGETLDFSLYRSHDGAVNHSIYYRGKETIGMPTIEEIREFVK